MSKLKTYFKNCVRPVKMCVMYVKAAWALAKAFCHRLTGNGFYDVHFRKVGTKWYCDVPGFPKELFDHTLMVAGAANFIEYYSKGESEVEAVIKIADETENKWHCGASLYKTRSTLTGGAFYKVDGTSFDEEIWLCPVTLFLLGKYPERILLYRMNKNILSCPIYIE